MMAEHASTPNRAVAASLLAAVIVLVATTVVIARQVGTSPAEEVRVAESPDPSPAHRESSTIVSDPSIVPQPAPLQAAPGWMAYGVTPALEPMGFIETDVFFDPDLLIRPVFDEPDGDLIGYATPYLPLIEPEIVEAPGFDLERYALLELGPARYEALRAQVHDGAAP